LNPDIIVGDMDSIARPDLIETYGEADLHLLDRAKDLSDTEAGLILCSGRGATEIVIAGGGGGRLDHLLGIRALFERDLRPCEWHLALDSVYLVRAGTDFGFDSLLGDIVSVFPLAGGARGMSSRGLRWPLGGLAWGPGDYGLSNEASEEKILVTAGEGDLLVVRRWCEGS
jgi:thiamine pyrophosphokinase